jgi:uncharacterized protein
MRAFIALVPAAVVVTAVASYFAFMPDAAGSVRFWALAGGPTAALAAVAAVWAAREDFLRDWLAPRWGDFTLGLFVAAALYGAAWLFAHWVCPVGSPREIWLVSLYGQIGDPRELQSRAPAVGAAMTFIAVCEEVLWRGAVPQLLAERVGSRAAWVWAIALYPLAYAPTIVALGAGGHYNPVLFIAALGAGLVWSLLARALGRLGPSIVAHALFDWTAIMMFPLWGGIWQR